MDYPIPGWAATIKSLALRKKIHFSAILQVMIRCFDRGYSPYSLGHKAMSARLLSAFDRGYWVARIQGDWNAELGSSLPGKI